MTKNSSRVLVCCITCGRDTRNVNRMCRRCIGPPEPKTARTGRNLADENGPKVPNDSVTAWSANSPKEPLESKAICPNCGSRLGIRPRRNGHCAECRQEETDREQVLGQIHKLESLNITPTTIKLVNFCPTLTKSEIRKILREYNT